jgi:23S rRNA (pseudouridine1915-N3)-methyltransferase
MLSVTVIAVGNLKESYLREAIKEYEKRLAAYCKFSIVELKDNTPILPHLPECAYRIALCVEGKMKSSEELAALIDQKATEGFSELCFVIGAFDGLPEEVKAACQLRLSFSKMTFPHQLMRVILAEQIYRAFTINAGSKYHK